ncbi:uncharacterized protein T551_00886 [Pneumocystis jirovecii RU7]|uniref:ATPase inhibitor, mitochondrial n=1 Tax=Pneumocystis jirovecii (strain RU7) TaxID=1408657 RepID=A0A0W4ZV04_PNEJ7|nr:uncharacterized protein T551_00886 [Pneumocystis jirovecii RU7]KTW32204.1 hypothetical protein T551_00886 [Pneumocystis jirovecii RU7]
MRFLQRWSGFGGLWVQRRGMRRSSVCFVDETVLPGGADALRKREKASEDMYIRKKEIERLKGRKNDVNKKESEETGKSEENK